MKQDITQYSDQELSLIVFNDEFLYSIRHLMMLKSTLDDMYQYTADQWEELISDLEDDYEEQS